ncbi:MAG: hypothetical protein FWG68_00285 [Defluviitaleaceae bacterium]|nr:hypothetical protein [Defluviitaleaceae bacterium]
MGIVGTWQQIFGNNISNFEFREDGTYTVFCSNMFGLLSNSPGTWTGDAITLIRDDDGHITTLVIFENVLRAMLPSGELSNVPHRRIR